MLFRSISTVTSKFINLLITYVVVFGIIFVTQFGVNITALLYLPVILIAEYIFSLGGALLLSSIDVYFRDIEHITGVLLMAWVWGTPIMYAKEAAGTGILGKVIDINPLTWFIDAFHAVLYDKCIPDLKMIGVCYLSAVILLLIGEMVFMSLEKNFVEEL